MSKEKTTTKKTTKPKETEKSKEVKSESKPKSKKTSSEVLDKFAVVEIQGSQLKVSEGKKYEVDHIEGNKGDEIVLDKVLLFSEGSKTKIGKPYLDKAKVKAVIESQKKGEKVEGLLFKAKSRYRRKYGHRALITRLLIKEINA